MKSQPTNDNLKKSSRKKYMTGCIVLIFVMIIALAVMFLFGYMGE